MSNNFFKKFVILYFSNQDITLNRTIHVCGGMPAFIHLCICACIFIDSDTQFGTNLLLECLCNDVAMLKA
jgi:hypothetical protein